MGLISRVSSRTYSMDLKELLSYKPDTDANKGAKAPEKDDSAFKAPLAKKPRQVLGQTPDPYGNLSATPGHTPRKLMAAGTPFHRPGNTPRLDLVPPQMTPNSNRADSTPKIYPTSAQLQARNGGGTSFPDHVETVTADPNHRVVQDDTINEDARLEELLEKLEAEQAQADPATKVPLVEDEKAARRLIKDLKRKFTDNQGARVKSEDPNKFWKSEMDLATVLEHMRGFATAWEFYSLLDYNLFKSIFIPLMSHPNVDITVSLISLLQELTDTLDESQVEKQEEALIALTELAKTLFNEEFNFLTLLVQLLNRLDE